MYAIVHEDMVKELEHLDEETQCKVIWAYVKYQLYWIEPSKDDVLVYSIFKAKQFTLNQTKTKAEVARENGKKWWRPKKDLSDKNLSKTKKTQQKPKANPEQTQKNQDIKIKDNNIKDNNIIILKDNILSNTESKDSDTNITSNINELISELKDLTKEYGVAYDNKNERNFAKHILTAKEFWNFAEWIWQSRVEFAKNILIASVMIHYWKWVCAWPMMIYQNYAEVYNKAMQEHAKQQKNKIYSF